ncbi:MAG: sigma-54 dependent transcriptional regulator [bacterium]|nr:sigma-54 dependent transcriptional regulator [bacterium]
MQSQLLFADRELAEQIALDRLPINGGIRIHHAFNHAAIRSTLEQRDIVLLIIPALFEGLDLLLSHARRLHPKLRCILTGDLSSTKHADWVNLLPKPINPKQLEQLLRDCLDPNDQPRKLKGMGGPFAQLLTRSPKILEALEYASAVAATGQPVLITGETGTGKDLLARAIHLASGLSGQMVAVNVAGLDTNHFSDTLFGHQKGAFTGADQARRGQIKLAESGTLFLDEIGDLSPESQVKLLRLVQEGEYLPLGSDQFHQSHARILVATNRDLVVDMEQGRFRKDLYYRLATHKIEMPPLRERLEDLPLLIDHFLNSALAQYGKPAMASEGLVSVFDRYPFPGNIRELKALLYDGAAICRDLKSLISFFEAKLAPRLASKPGDANSIHFGEELPTMHEVRRLLVTEALKRTDDNRNQAASLLGIRRQSLNYYLK